MDRRNVLRTLGGATICGLAGCSSKDETESVAPPPLTGILLWSVLEAGQTVSAQVTVEKGGSEIFETVHEFEGESRFYLKDKDWMGNNVPYSVTIEATSSGERDTYSSSDLPHPEPDDCWIPHAEIYSSSLFLTPLIDEEHC
ncbi:hypothetical protein [Natrinema thermotolerans]